MKTVVDLRLTQEAARFDLRFACEDCVHFCDRHGCAHGYPEAPSKRDLETEQVVFCKEFEIA